MTEQRRIENPPRRSARNAWILIAVLLALSIVATYWTWTKKIAVPLNQRGPSAGSVTDVLAAPDNAGFARATAPRPFVFPEDHGPHRAFRSEWWYFTGHLVARRGDETRRFGYQFTIFRQALAPETPARASAWATRDVYMAHLAVSDLDGRRFGAFERLAREGLSLAGAETKPFRVWLEGWSLNGPPTAEAVFPMSVKAEARREQGQPGDLRDVALALTIDQGRGPIPQGDRGLSAKGPEAGNASFYYSMTRLPTRGRLTVDGQTYEIVSGESWLDREWSTSALGPTLAGWDWLALHLADGRDLMVYRLRRKDGGMAGESRATLIAPDGSTRLFAPDAFTLEERGRWQSPRSGKSYPAGLRIAVADLDLEVRPLLAHQELPVTFTYWEGAFEARARERVAGRGYLEMTGY
jgi:predicted secreted hydrolase